MDKALATQLANIEKRTGKSLAELTRCIKKSGLSKHGEMRDMLKSDLGMGHGDANTLVHYVASIGRRLAAAAGKPSDAVLDEIYAGPKPPSTDSRGAHARDREVRRVRGRAEEGLRQPAAEEAVRHDRSGDEHAGSRLAST